MKRNNNRTLLGDLVIFALTAGFLGGILFVFGPCGPKEDGSFMVCHWAGRAITGVAAVMAALGLIHLIVGSIPVKQGIDISLILLSCLAFAIPGRLIKLCMMADMRCHSIMHPAVGVFSAAVAIAAAADLIMCQRRA